MRNPKLVEVLSEKEQSELERIANCKEAVSALKKVLLFDMYYNGIMEKGKAPEANRNFAWNIVKSTPRAELADKLAVNYEAVMIVEGAFQDIESFVTPVEIVPSTGNKGR
jgi:hypothetical protein